MLFSDLHCDLFYVSTSLHTFRYLYLTSHTYEFERRRMHMMSSEKLLEVLFALSFYI